MLSPHALWNPEGMGGEHFGISERKGGGGELKMFMHPGVDQYVYFLESPIILNLKTNESLEHIHVYSLYGTILPSIS